MSGPDSTIPPATATKTLPPDPASADSLPVIAAGQAQHALTVALDKVAEAFVELEATAMAIARALDENAARTTGDRP